MLQKKAKKNNIQIGLHISLSSIHKINNRSLWIWKNKFIFNLIIHQPDIEKIYLYAKDPYNTKCQFSIKKRKSTGLKHLNDSKAFIEYSNNMDNIDRF